MATRTESRLTGRIAVRDQHGTSYVVVERTDFMHITYLDNSQEPPIAGLKEYLLNGRHVNKVDDNTFATPDGRLTLSRA